MRKTRPLAKRHTNREFFDGGVLYVHAQMTGIAQCRVDE